MSAQSIGPCLIPHERAGASVENLPLVVFGGLCQPGYRDNQTWLLGPLGDAPERWQWWEVQADGETHSDNRPTARFHHAVLVASLPSPITGALEQQLLVLGGDDKRVRPIWDDWVLSLANVRLQPDFCRDISLVFNTTTGLRTSCS